MLEFVFNYCIETKFSENEKKTTGVNCVKSDWGMQNQSNEV